MRMKNFVTVSTLFVLLGLVAGCHYQSVDRHYGTDRGSYYSRGYGSYRDGFRNDRVYERRRDNWRRDRYDDRYGSHWR